jgi:hypothetical protein
MTSITSKELIATFFAEPQMPGSREFRLFAKLLLHHIADHWYELRLLDGVRMENADSTDSPLALRECAEAALIPERTGRDQLGQSLIADPDPKDVCMTCAHVHEKDDCCGVNLGKGGVCECKAEVRA